MFPLTWMVSLAAAQECPQTSTPAEFQARLTQAEAALADLEAEAFNVAMDDAAFMVPCLDSFVSPATAAHYHRLQGLRQYMVGEEERAAQAFAAARALEPTYEFPLTLLPDGHAARQLYGRLPLENGTTETAPDPIEGAVRFDGTQTLVRPTAWPTVAQVQQDDTLTTAYLLPGDALPSYEGVLPDPPPFANIAWLRSRQQAALLGGGLVLGVASAGVYSLAAVNAERYGKDELYPNNDALTAQEAKVNGLVVASSVLGVAAVGTVGASFLVVEW